MNDLRSQMGLELLGTVNLLGVPDESDTPADRVGTITSNAPIESFYLESVNDGDALFSFLPEDFIITRNGVPELPVFEDTTGTETTDWFSADADGNSVDGAGEDLFTIWNQFRDEDGPAIATTGEGADTIDARVWNASDGQADDIYLRVTDFEPEEDVLQVGVFQTDNEVSGFEIVEAEDGSYTDVLVRYTGSLGLGPATAVIRLEGTTGLTADQVVINT